VSDGREHAIKLLDDFSDVSLSDVHAAGVAWTLQQRAVAYRENATMA
jgi:hypothetical protein